MSSAYSRREWLKTSAISGAALALITIGTPAEMSALTKALRAILVPG